MLPAVTALMVRLSPHSDLSKSRLETLCYLVISMVSSRTVNLSHLASESLGRGQIASSYRRLQRFFQHVTLTPDWSAPLIVWLLGMTNRRWYLCLDRTNWRIGTRDVNILMLAIATKRFRVPLLWTVLDKAGNSNTAERINLMKRYLALFDASTIHLLLADREFIGHEWLKFLNDNNVGFAIRMKEDNLVQTQAARLTRMSSIVHTRGNRIFRARFPDGDQMFDFAAKRIKQAEWLIIATNRDPAKALRDYKKRWAIECLFGDAKTKGLNLEDTRLICPRKISSLLVLLALAVTWANITASRAMGRANLPRKKHGFYAKSWFRYGFDLIRKLLRTDPIAAIAPWDALRRKSPGVV